jgi:hypothetical protein
MVKRVGEEISGLKAGMTAKLDTISPRLRRHRACRQVGTYAQVRAAIMCEAPYTGVINGRTRITTAGGEQLTLEYPIRTANVSNATAMWQMDAGPLLLPLPGPAAAAALSSDMPVAGLGVGYLVPLGPLRFLPLRSVAVPSAEIWHIYMPNLCREASW